METKIKIKLPKEIVVNIPSFGEINVDSVLDVIATEGKRRIYDEVKERVLGRFVRENEEFIENAVVKILKNKKKELSKKLAETIDDAFGMK